MKNFSRLLCWTEQHLDCPLTTADLAAVAGCSVRHLYTGFRNLTGNSPAEYIRRRKLTLAAYMLRCSGRSVTDIANMYGFSTPQAFSRVFSHHFRQSPRAWRQASEWDMRLFYPAATLTTPLPFRHDIVTVNGLGLQTDTTDVTRVAFGFNFLLLAEDNRIITVAELHAHYIRLFTASGDSAFTVLGNMIPGSTGYDAEISISTGRLIQTDRQENGIIPAPSGDYARFTTTGAWRDIMGFLAWAGGHGLHRYHHILKRGPTFTCFTPEATPGYCRAEHHIPIVLPVTDRATLS